MARLFSILFGVLFVAVSATAQTPAAKVVAQKTATAKSARVVKVAKVAAPRPLAGTVQAVVQRAIPKKFSPETAAQLAQSFDEVSRTIHDEHIIPWMVDLAQKGSVVDSKGRHLKLRDLLPVWANKTQSMVLEDRFRDAFPNTHEMVPADRILEVMFTAHSTRDMRWIYLQHMLRASTDAIIFKPSKTIDPKTNKPYADAKGVILKGHSGALYESYNNTENPATNAQADFHDDLRAAFHSSKDPVEAAKKLKAVYEDWVWDGTDLGFGVSNYSHYLDKSASTDANHRTSARQQKAFVATIAAFDNVIADLQTLKPEAIVEALHNATKPFVP